ncbi:MAG TPA: hypothetical protein P5519_03995 [Spirochaetia bacterium]|nr:hypothetical protein [Spirochaetales bacterium]HRS65032.1 hypothetical protein [Spirochaetia bacterium]HOT58991.1 hypothetical protein [Spirochaetales bacterium]HPD79740.1 hypothetical protein [Spirochaetales bacterium]HQK34594.1 hypothetical protein [Spirochaetales bacterium]
MDDKGKELLRHLISELEGAPYPHLLDNELYSIWYNHVQETAHEALEYLNSFQETEHE